MTDPPPASACPDCGAPLPPESPQSLCPACLMRQALASRTVARDGDPAPRLPPPSPDEIADRFPGYEILECLGRGGMGAVYKARQKSLNRLVAIKILAPERVGEGRFAERFTIEAELLAKLGHPHIVTIHDFGETGGLFYLVMEFIDGVNLRDLLRDGKLEPQQALAIVPPICDALQYAHDKGIVHRDIKPENVLLDRDGRVKIADFGIASLVGASGEESGTPPYMAPEQSGGTVDRRADIYALGVVLYEMLTGERPEKDLVAPSKRVEVDVKIDEMVLRALEKEPERRYQTAGEFRTMVETMAAIPPDRTDRGRGDTRVSGEQRQEGSGRTLTAQSETWPARYGWLSLIAIGLGVLTILGAFANLSFSPGIAEKAAIMMIGSIFVAGGIIGAAIGSGRHRSGEAVDSLPGDPGAAESSETKAERRKWLRRASLLGILAVMVLVAGITFMVKVVPQWEESLASRAEAAPRGMALLFGASHFIQRVWPLMAPLLLILGVASVAGLVISARRMAAKTVAAEKSEGASETRPVPGPRVLDWAVLVSGVLSGLLPTLFYWLKPWAAPWLSPEGQQFMLYLTLACGLLACAGGWVIRKRWTTIGKYGAAWGAISLTIWMLFFLAGQFSNGRHHGGHANRNDGGADPGLARYDWEELNASGELSDGVAEKVDGRTVLKIENLQDEPLQARLLAIENPPIKAKRYAIEGEIRYENVEGAAYLEMWNNFPHGRFFSRTLNEPGSGPLAQLTGTSDWRPFILPFDQTGSASPPNRIEVNLHLPGTGVVFVGPLRLVEAGPPGEEAVNTVEDGEPPNLPAMARRQRFVPRAGMGDRSSWTLLPEGSALHSSGWAAMARLTLGGKARFTHPGDEAPFLGIEILEGDADWLQLAIQDLAAGDGVKDLKITVRRGEPASILVDGVGYKVLFPNQQVALDQPETTPFATVMILEAREEELSFGPEEEVVLPIPRGDFRWLDLESGEFLTMAGDPEYAELEEEQREAGELVDFHLKGGQAAAWRRRHGADVAGWKWDRPGAPPAVIGLDLSLVRLAAEQWETLTPRHLDVLLGINPSTGDRGVDGEGSVMGFRTQEGRPGLLQITGLAEDGRGVKVRYKLAHEADHDGGNGLEATGVRAGGEGDAPIARLIIAKERGGQWSPEGILYSLDGEVIVLEKLQEKFHQMVRERPELRVIVHANDPELPAGRVLTAVQAARDAGVKQVRVSAGEACGEEPAETDRDAEDVEP